MSLTEELVVLGDVAHLSTCEQFVASVHIHAERLQDRERLIRVGDDILLLVLELRQEVTTDALVDAKLQHLRVDEDQLKLLGTLII